MIGILKVLVAVIAAYMSCDELILTIDTKPVRISFQSDFSAGILGQDRITIGIECDTELRRNSSQSDRSDIEAISRQRV